MSSNGTANMSCSTNATRSAGARVSSTTSMASPTESASSASCSGLVPAPALSPAAGVTSASGSSRRAARERSMSRHTRATTVVSQPPRFSTPSDPERLSRSQDSWTASSASLGEPSIRYATARSRARWSSNCAASQSSFVTVTFLRRGPSLGMTIQTGSR